ncbi:MAG: response regulator [Planctomycetes bacterium]|nr:response regulator [Planctomycetota bacterium]
MACTTYNGGHSLTSNNYAFRPYFQNAIIGNETIYPALGVTTGIRGLYVSAPIWEAESDKPVGVLVIKTMLNSITSLLKANNEQTALISPDGIVFAASNRDWLYRSCWHLPEERIAEIRQTKQFASQPLIPLSMDLSKDTAVDGIHQFNVVKIPVDILSADSRHWMIISISDTMKDYPVDILLAATAGIIGLSVLVILHIILSHHKVSLEQRVEERDRALLVTSEKLKHETHEREQAQEALIRAERMAAMGTLAGGVAHEFNNINTAILGFSDLLLLESNLNADDKECVARIRGAAKRAASVTHNLLTFSGVRKAEPKPSNLVLAVKDTVSLVKRDFEKDAIEIVEKLSPIPDTVMDAAQIGQVILNLLINARHALIESKNKNITIETFSDSNWVAVRVSDNGCGIAKENLELIFTPFFSTKGEHAKDGSAQSKIKGTGLGLSVSHTIIANHNGQFIVESEVGKGTSFTIRLPIISSSSCSTESPTPATRKLKHTGNILIVDDEDDTRDLLHVFLGRAGYQVSTASDGEEALAALGDNGIDLIIADLRMAGMTGMEMFRKISELPEDKKPALIAISGQVSQCERAELEKLGVSTIIIKPFELEPLLETVYCTINK